MKTTLPETSSNLWPQLDHNANIGLMVRQPDQTDQSVCIRKVGERMENQGSLSKRESRASGSPALSRFATVSALRTRKPVCVSIAREGVY